MNQTEKETNPKATVPENINEPIMLEGIHSPEPEPMPVFIPEAHKTGYAVVGLGHLTLGEILPALKASKRCRIAALVSGDSEKLSRTAAMYGISEDALYSYDNFDDIVNNPQVDAVYIVLPNSMHKEFTIRAAKAGKHVLCEKPMAVSSAECEEMIAVCRKHKVKLMIAYRIQYEPYNTYVKEQIKKGTLGKIKFVEAQNGQKSGNPAHWRYRKALAGGGALPDIGLYCLNTTRFILDAEPEEVFATVYSNPDDPHFKEVEENAVWQMRFPDNLVVQCSTHYQTYETKRYRVLGSESWLDLDNAYAYVGQKLKHGKEEENKAINQIDIEHVNQFAQEMDYFSLCITDGLQPYTPGEVGLQDQLIMEAIYESAAANKPVSLKGKLLKDLNRGEAPNLEKLK